MLFDSFDTDQNELNLLCVLVFEELFPVNIFHNFVCISPLVEHFYNFIKSENSKNIVPKIVAISPKIQDVSLRVCSPSDFWYQVMARHICVSGLVFDHKNSFLVSYLLYQKSFALLLFSWLYTHLFTLFDLQKTCRCYNLKSDKS